MISTKAVLLITILLGISVAQQACQETDPTLSINIRNGVTFQTQQWPIESNNWAGKVSCQGCNTSYGDTPCTTALPVLCILHHKVITRPYYNYSNQSVPFENPDRGFYNGWTGGIFTVTPPVRGYDVDSFAAGDLLCKSYWGKNAKFAEFNDGYYLDYMNSLPHKEWSTWNWATAKCGGWGFWGYFNHQFTGRTWIWSTASVNANCGSK